MKLFNFTLGGNANTPNIKEESVTSSICVCVCVCVCVYFYLKKKKKKKLETMCKKKFNLKKLCIKQ